ncbi:hypothetical protein ACO0K9_05565 [Undibacterium sp. Ji50W]|uniref:hypothetical protein n=1 Tax=Undibacterium sp. Ji50W TaxID=3413041 RepID=UPI003BF0624F
MKPGTSHLHPQNVAYCHVVTTRQYFPVEKARLHFSEFRLKHGTPVLVASLLRVRINDLTHFYAFVIVGIFQQPAFSLSFYVAWQLANPGC